MIPVNLWSRKAGMARARCDGYLSLEGCTMAVACSWGAIAKKKELLMREKKPHGQNCMARTAWSISSWTRGSFQEASWMRGSIGPEQRASGECTSAARTRAARAFGFQTTRRNSHHACQTRKLSPISSRLQITATSGVTAEKPCLIAALSLPWPFVVLPARGRATLTAATSSS